jgi:hypothetical protein
MYTGKTKIILLAFSVMFFAITLNVDAYVASSTNYRIDSDAISVGGKLSTSTAYSLESSLASFSSETSTSSSFSVYSGYLQMATPYLAVSSPSNVTMSPAIYTGGGGQGNGSASWAVTTDSSGGYSLSISASTNPALKSSDDSFSNYFIHSVGVPNFAWGLGDEGEGFGFTPEGVDIKTAYKDDGVSLCNISGGIDTSDRCWDSIDTDRKIVAEKTSSNHPGGSQTTIKFRAEVGSMAIHKKAGDYSATVTVTVLAL